MTLHKHINECDVVYVLAGVLQCNGGELEEAVDGASLVDYLSCFYLVLLYFRARLFVDALWSPAWKGLTSWLSFVMSNCDVVIFPLVTWVRCGAQWYRFLIFALFLTSNVFSSSIVC